MPPEAMRFPMTPALYIPRRGSATSWDRGARSPRGEGIGDDVGVLLLLGYVVMTMAMEVQISDGEESGEPCPLAGPTVLVETTSDGAARGHPGTPWVRSTAER